MQKWIDFINDGCKYFPKIWKLRKMIAISKKAILNGGLLSAPGIYFMIKVAFFQKN
jgi:hypothetical protein